MSKSGSCLCGAVRYEVLGPLFEVSHCHCSMCRRQHGAAFATYAQFEAGHFRWVGGESYLKIYETESGAGWCFCIQCGSTLAASNHGEITSITLGTLQDDPETKPEYHIFVASKAPWFEITDELPKHKTGPEPKPLK